LGFDNIAIPPCVWITEVGNIELAKSLVEELSNLPAVHHPIEQEHREMLNPRFGYESSEKLSARERASIRVDIQRVRRGGSTRGWAVVAKPFLKSIDLHLSAWQIESQPTSDNHSEHEQTQPSQETAAMPLAKPTHDGFVSATAIRTEHTPDGIVLEHRKLVKFLKLHSKIRTKRPVRKDGKPRKNRLLVNLTDWYEHNNALIEWYRIESRDSDLATGQDTSKRLEAVHAKNNPQK
jgi:hypothetical protein